MSRVWVAAMSTAAGDPLTLLLLPPGKAALALQPFSAAAPQSLLPQPPAACSGVGQQRSLPQLIASGRVAVPQYLLPEQGADRRVGLPGAPAPSCLPMQLAAVGQAPPGGSP